jgi:hypothetical protein
MAMVPIISLVPRQESLFPSPGPGAMLCAQKPRLLRVGKLYRSGLWCKFMTRSKAFLWAQQIFKPKALRPPRLITAGFEVNSLFFNALKHNY